MRVFIERFVLAILASLVVLLAAINPMGFSWPARIISIIAIVIVAGIAAYFAGWDEWRWEHLRAVWWLWLISGVSAGVALAVWLCPFIFGPLQDFGALQSQISTKTIELDNVKQQLASAQSQLTSRQTELDQTKQQLSQLIGPHLAINLANILGASDDARIIPKTFVILTSKPDNELIHHDLEIILNWAFALSSAKGNLLPMGLPNYQKDLDVPRLEERGEPGITIHGRNQAGDFLMRTLSNGNCFNTHQTGDTPNELLPYYHNIWPGSTDVTAIVWIEIGPGPAVTSTTCLHQ